YSEHNDYRYFESGDIDIQNRIIELNGEKFGVIICEDGWNDFEFFERNLYKIDPVEKIAPLVDTLLCPSSSCTRAKKEQLKHNMMSHAAKKYSVNYIYVNQVGANDELVYDGLSRMYNKQGEIIAMAQSFKEDCAIINTKTGGEINPLPKGLELTLNSQKEFSLDHGPDLERTYKAITLAIKEYFSKNGFKRAVLGLSGGLDSSICAVLLADALGSDNVLGVSMPSKLTSPNSKSDAETLANNLGIHFIEIPIKDSHDILSEKFENMFSKINWCDRYTYSYTQDNIQARSRAMILWGIANEYSQTLPIATSDKSELYMGYATINGDMSGGYAPICDVVKTKLFALGYWMNENREIKHAIPLSVLKKPPGAELAINPETGKTLLAEEALMPYEFLDEVIWRIENLHQVIDDMLDAEFLYEKKNSLTKLQKKAWLEKFFNRMNKALYKWYIVPPGPVIDARSINKAEFRQPIISNIKYKEKLS
ncbi:NAD(+) synthase, partial [bacterium]|nr:NAD(+) synthase [bacterium]